jgi:hypothetical protein
MSETYNKECCPHCNSINWICLGDLSDMTSNLGNGSVCKCWKCEKKFWLVSFHEMSESDYEFLIDGWDSSKTKEENLEECEWEQGREVP